MQKKAHSFQMALNSQDYSGKKKKKKKQEFNGKSAGNKMGFASLEMFCRNVCDFSSSPAPVLPALSSGTMGMARAQSSPPSSRLPFLEN